MSAKHRRSKLRGHEQVKEAAHCVPHLIVRPTAIDDAMRIAYGQRVQRLLMLPVVSRG